MTRWIVLVGMSLSLLGAACTGGSALVCANDLDGTEFGFTVTVPADFQCTGVFPNPFTLGQVRYIQDVTGVGLSVQVNPPASNDSQSTEGYTSEQLPPVTTANGITFERTKITLQSLNAVSIAAGYTLPSGNNLFVTVVTTSDPSTLEATLNTVLETVQLTATP